MRLVLLIVALLVLPSVPATPVAPGLSDRHAAGGLRVDVGFASWPGLAEGAIFAGARVIAVDAALRLAVLDAPDAGLVRASLAGDANVRYVEVVPRGSLGVDSFTPNDPSFPLPRQDGLRRIRAPDAWATTLGDAGVSICFVDTGINAHQDLPSTRLRAAQAFYVPIEGTTFDVRDSYPHGTSVASVAVAGINDGVGMAGVANVSFLSAKVLDYGGNAYADDMARGIRWCADNAGPRAIISMSVHATDALALRDAVAYAAAHGALLVASAGNLGPCAGCVGYPAAYPEVIAVGCATRLEVACAFTSQGAKVEISAVGESILAASAFQATNYVWEAGTSFATPFVSGALALAWSADPTLNASTLRARLDNSARDLGAPGRDATFGFGMVDARCLLDNTSPCTATPPASDLIPCQSTLPDLGSYACAPIPYAPIDVTGAPSWQSALSGSPLEVPIDFPFELEGVPQSSLYARGFGDLLSIQGLVISPHSAFTDATVRVLHAGVAPHRSLVVDWSRVVPTYDGGGCGACGCCTDGDVPFGAFQVIMREGSDAIETQITMVSTDGYIGLAHADRSWTMYAHAQRQDSAVSKVAFTFTPDARLPRGLTATPGLGAGEITLTWGTPNAGATSYHIERADAATGPYSLIGETSASSFVDPTVPNGATRWYRVSGDGAATIPRAATAFALPSAPRGLVVVTGPGRGEISLNWTAPASDGGTPLTGYEVQTPDGIVPVNATSWTERALPDGAARSYQVRARNLVGPGAPALASGIAPRLPAPPVGLAAAPGWHAITLSWNASGDTGGVPIRYHVYAQNATDGPFTLIRDTSATTITDSGLPDRAARRYHVAAANVVGESLPAELDAKPLPVPAKVTGIVVTAGPGRGQLSARWDNATIDGAMATYSVALGSASSGYTTKAKTTALSAVVSGLADGTSYGVIVVAVNEYGLGAWPTEVRATTLAQASQPRNFTASTVTSGAQFGHVLLAWEPPIRDGGAPVVGYNVYQAPLGLLRVAFVTGASYEDASCIGVCTYQVRAVTAWGESAASAFAPAFGVPHTPSP